MPRLTEILPAGFANLDDETKLRAITRLRDQLNAAIHHLKQKIASMTDEEKAARQTELVKLATEDLTLE